MGLSTLPIDWEDVENALHRWFSDSTDLSCVIWGNQDAPQPPYPYGVITIIAGPTKVGGIDETRQEPVADPLPAAPAFPIELLKVGPREITLSCQINVGPPDDQSPANNSRSMMSAAQAALGLPSFTDPLREAGLAVIEELPIGEFNIQIADIWVSRSQMDVRFGLTSSVREESPIIETVEITAGDPFNLDKETFGGSTP